MMCLYIFNLNFLLNLQFFYWVLNFGPVVNFGRGRVRMNFGTLISCFISVKHKLKPRDCQKLKPRDCHIILCLGLGADICDCRGGRGHLTKVLIFLFFPHMHTFFVLNLQLYIITLEAGVCAKPICILQSQARTPLRRGGGCIPPRCRALNRSPVISTHH